MYKKEFKFENGDQVKEVITGFAGTITGTAFYLTGCNQYAVTAQSKDNAEPITLWADEGRLQLEAKSTFTESDVKAEKNGCDVKPPYGKRM